MAKNFFTNFTWTRIWKRINFHQCFRKNSVAIIAPRPSNIQVYWSAIWRCMKESRIFIVKFVEKHFCIIFTWLPTWTFINFHQNFRKMFIAIIALRRSNIQVHWSAIWRCMKEPSHVIVAFVESLFGINFTWKLIWKCNIMNKNHQISANFVYPSQF